MSISTFRWIERFRSCLMSNYFNLIKKIKLNKSAGVQQKKNSFHDDSLSDMPP